MKRFVWLVLFIMLLPCFAFCKPLTWEAHLKKAEQLVSEGRFEQAINYLSVQSKREDLMDMDRLVIATFAVNHIFKYGDKKQALYVIKPIHDKLVKSYGIKSTLASWARRLLIPAYLKREEYDKALRYANIAVKSASTKKSLAEAYVFVGNVYREREEYSRAIKHYLKAEQLFKQSDGKDKSRSDMGGLYNNLAVSYDAMGDFQNALKTYRIALKIRQKNDSSYYRTLFNMTSTYRALGQADKARGYLIEIADYRLKVDGVNSLGYIMIENEIAVLDANYGRYNEALVRYKKVLSYGERLERDEIKALALKNMGSVYNDLEDDKLALSYLEKSLAIYQKLPPSLEIANNYGLLAIVASTQKSFQKELDFYDKSLAIRKALHKENEPDYAQVLTNKAMAYQKQRDYQQADIIYQQSFTLLQKIQPKGEKMGFLLVNWATLRVGQKDYSRAEPMFLEGIEILKLSVGEKHPTVAYAYNNIATVYRLMNQKIKAADYYQKAVAISGAASGLNDPSTKLYSRNLLLEKVEQGVSRRRLW